MKKALQYLALMGFASALLSAAWAQSPPGLQPGQILTYRGICEPSGAVAIPRGSFAEAFAVANDEDNILRAYRAGGGDPLPRADAPPIGDMNRFLGLDPKDEDDRADLEGAAWLEDRIFWLGSHSRSNPGRMRRARHQLFVTMPRGAPASPDFALVPEGTSVSLLSALREAGLGGAIGGDGRDEELSPNRRGLNLEGLAAGADGTSLILGLRGPLRDGRATLLRIENPFQAIAGTPVRLGEPILLNLHGRGVRSMDYVESRGRYLIVAGPPTDADPGYTDGPRFRLYAWSGRAQDDVVALSETDAEMRRLAEMRFTPEAMIVEASGDRIQLLSDDGDFALSGAQVCKDRPESQREFRGVVLRLSW